MFISVMDTCKTLVAELSVQTSVHTLPSAKSGGL